MKKLAKHQFCQIAKCQRAFFGITVNFIIQKLKSKDLLYLSFLWGFFTHIAIPISKIFFKFGKIVHQILKLNVNTKYKFYF